MTNGKQILIVDDDSEFLETLCEQLQLHEEFKSVTCTSGAEALKTAKEDRFDVIILDVGLPDMDGREVCRLMRRNGVTSPIIMLTGADTDADTILGLDAGANDYVTKPFRLGVLLARLRRSSSICIAPGTRSWAVISCWARSGAITPGSRPTPWKPTFIACVRRSKAIRRTPACWSPNPAATGLFRNRNKTAIYRSRAPSAFVSKKRRHAWASISKSV